MCGLKLINDKLVGCVDCSNLTPYTKRDVKRTEYMRRYRQKKRLQKNVIKTVQQ